MSVAVGAAVTRPRPRAVYVGASLLMGLIAVVGFWPTYFGPLVQGTLAQPPLIHLHATVFTGWLVLFLAQAALAAAGRVRWHLRVGRVGVGYGIVLIVVGLSTGIVRSAALPLGGEAEDLLFAAVSDMVVFAAFFGAAIAFRRKPQVHKRLMMVAATMLLIAAVARMSFLPPLPEGIPVRMALWFSPVLLAMAHDGWSRRMVHPAYVIGLGAFVLRIVSVPLSQTAAWAAVTRWVVHGLAFR